MSLPVSNLEAALSRRGFFSRVGSGLLGVALADLLASELSGAAADNPPPPGARQVFDVTPKHPHVRPRAKAVIQLFMNGGPSQVDLFDPKPALEKYDGQKFPGSIDVQQPDLA